MNHEGTKDTKVNGPKLKRDWVGLRVRARRDIQIVHGIAPKGTHGVVDGYYHGCVVIFEAMGADDMPLRITQVQCYSLEVVTPPEEWPNTEGDGR